MLDTLAITRPQLVDLGLLVGSDFHPGIKGIGPKRALWRASNRSTSNPKCTTTITSSPGRCDANEVVRFLCDEHAFGHDRVRAALDRAFGPGKLF
jgi:flap endonuclease-1